MQNKELEPLVRGILSCGNLKGVKFAYSLHKNKKLILEELKDLHKSQSMSEENEEKYKEYDKKREELCNVHAIKDGGVSVVKNGQYMMKDKDAFQSALDVLRSEYTEVLKAEEERKENYNKIMEEDTSIDLFMVQYEDLPEDITAAQLESIIQLVQD